MLIWSTLSTIFSCVLFVHAAPPPAAKKGISTLTPAEVTKFKPYSFYASTAYCEPSKTRSWNCGFNCKANPGFRPIASGGDGALVQYWYVGYDPALQTTIVAYQGTKPTKIVPILTNIKLTLDSLDSFLFPGISRFVKIHNGFGEAQDRHSVLAAVKTAFAEYGTKKVTLVGHSLGGAIALISSIYLKLHLPAGTVVETITYGMPRVGNQAFADYPTSSNFASRIANGVLRRRKDLVPIIPGRRLGFRHPKGERHIQSSGSWTVCPGQDDTRSQCTRGSVPSIHAGSVKDIAVCFMRQFPTPT
ncbi:lipase [Infundibulicybe gibba]|nr:lipase [Infundibulicybe gibba]